MKVFIAGKVTGTTDYIERFERMEKELEELGLEVVNPVKETRYLGDDAPWVEYMRVTIPLLCACDAIYLMPDWIDSNGAALEMLVADGLGLLEMKEPTSRERIRNS